MHRFLAPLALCLGLAAAARAQTAQQSVTVIVQEINALSVSSGAVTLSVNSATAGAQPDAVANGTTSYNITTNGSAKKVVAQLDAAYASGIQLQLAAAAPSGSGASTGAQVLGATAMDVVTGLTRVRGSGMALTYTASATVDALPNAGAGGESHTVTFTITNS